MASENTFSENIRGVSDLVESGINKVAGSGGTEIEGVTGDKIDVLDLPMTDEELLKLRDEWEKKYAPYEARIIPIFQRNLRSYLGRTRDNTVPIDDQIVAANLQFEAEETFLPAVFAQQPGPFVYSDNTPEGNKIADDVQTMLEFHADQILLNQKLKIMVRQWSIYHLGVLKPGWNDTIKDVVVDNRKIQDFVFDPNGFVDAYGEFSSWLGERITLSAEKLIELFPKYKLDIELLVNDKLGTDVTYTEWWNDDYCFITFKDLVLDKHKNEFFNYKEEKEEENDFRKTIPQHHNHFAAPKKPYIFLSVFSLQERPHDITGLIEQNIPNQEKISRRTEQIDTNLSQSNNGIAFSENNFNQETAKQASNALTKGVGKILVPPGGPIAEAIVRIPAPNLPGGFFDDLENSMNNLRSSWGTQGITSQAQKPDTTARGMILNQNRDTSRIGGGIGDVVEQSVARSVFNWLVQLYVVFYDEPHFGSVMGHGKATEYVVLQGKNIDRQLIVGVAPNSMKPKDEITKMNQAMELYKSKAIGPKVLLEALDFPNPDDAAADGVLWSIDPKTYLQLNFPELWAQVEQIMAKQQQEQAQMQQQNVAQQTQEGQQQMQQGEQVHQQKLAHAEQSHQQKMQQNTETASAKLATVPFPQ